MGRGERDYYKVTLINAMHVEYLKENTKWTPIKTFKIAVHRGDITKVLLVCLFFPFLLTYMSFLAINKISP